MHMVVNIFFLSFQLYNWLRQVWLRFMKRPWRKWIMPLFRKNTWKNWGNRLKSWYQKVKRKCLKHKEVKTPEKEAEREPVPVVPIEGFSTSNLLM